jgi:regulatory protein
MAKVRRSTQHHGSDGKEGEALVDRLLHRLVRSGAVDDGAYGRGKAMSLFRQGASLRKIEHKLKERGVPEALRRAILRELSDEFTEPDLLAACRFARRRRLGPFRKTRAEDESKTRQRELAALGRQGFSFEIARRVVDATDPGNLPSSDL